MAIFQIYLLFYCITCNWLVSSAESLIIIIIIAKTRYNPTLFMTEGSTLVRCRRHILGRQ